MHLNVCRLSVTMLSFLNIVLGREVFDRSAKIHCVWLLPETSLHRWVAVVTQAKENLTEQKDLAYLLQKEATLVWFVLL